jgi:hypothetical protein
MRRWLTLQLLRWIWTNEWTRGADQVILVVRYGARTWEVKMDRMSELAAAIWERERRGADAGTGRRAGSREGE